MKKIILSLSLLAFIGSVSFANTTVLNSTFGIELNDNGGDDEKCKKDCKKECCTKKSEKTEEGTEKKACCSKSKKSCDKKSTEEAK